MNKKIIHAVFVVVFVGGSFYAGLSYGKSSAPTPVRGQVGGNFTGVRGLRGGMGGFTVGEILSKDPTNITVKMQDGSSKIVLLSASTTVMKSISGSVSDLNAGENVTVQGSSNSDGSMTARSIQIRPVGAQPHTAQ